MNKGITLITLVVTIVILIILIGISINLTIGANGIITKARAAKEDFEMAKIKEESDLNELYSQMEIEQGTNNDNSIWKEKYDEIEEKLISFKEGIAEAISERGIETSGDDNLETMQENIRHLGKNVDYLIKDGVVQGDFDFNSSLFNYNSNGYFEIKSNISNQIIASSVDVTNINYIYVDYISSAYGIIAISKNNSCTVGATAISCSGMLDVRNYTGEYNLTAQISAGDAWLVSNIPGRIYNIYYK